MLGISTYAYLWRGSERAPAPMSLEEMLDDAAALGADAFQICDWSALAGMTAPALVSVREHAAERGLALEVGTRGTSPEVLERHLEIASLLGSRMLRSMWTAGDDRPTAAEVERRVRSLLPRLHDAGVSLALETYEQVSTHDLVALVESIGDPAVGICLDPANTVANLELPGDVVERCAPYVLDWHVKDFDFVRQEGWVGFSLVGVRMGSGRLPYERMLDALRPAERGIAQIVEHWLPWRGDAATTLAEEADWTAHAMRVMREA